MSESMVDASIWVVYGCRVSEVTAWRVVAPGQIIARIPGSPSLEFLFWGVNVFDSELEARRAALAVVDHFRRLYDDLAHEHETAIQSLTAKAKA